MKHSRHSLKNQYGLAVVELALITTVMLFLLMICGEFGRLFYQYNELTKSIHPATRYLSEHSLNGAGAVEISASDLSVAKNLIVYGNPQNTGQPRFANLSVNDVDIDVDATFVTTSVSWTYQSLFGGSLPTFQLADQDVDTESLVLRASLTMRVLN